MKAVCDRNDCTGCGLCASLCPQKCIDMRAVDKLGHLYPVIDASRCTDCGRCRKVCPSLSEAALSAPSAAYAAWAEDREEYESSASGGAAAVMARHILRKGGVVYGCAMLPGVEVRHIRIDREEDLPLVKGSKYVQSSIAEVLPLIGADVKGEFPVLFTGTPCQVAAVKNMFARLPDNLYLVDLVCHGVPSIGLLRRHVDRIMPCRDCKSVIFRSGNDFCLKINPASEGYRTPAYSSHLSTDRYKDFYLNAFMDGYTYRDSCYRCRFARPERIGDITIGDFWGLGKERSADDIPPHGCGCSLILPVSAKGAQLLEEIKPGLNIYRRTVSEAVEGNGQLKAAVHKGPRKVFYRVLARHTGGGWPYFLATADLRLRIKFKRRRQV